MRDKHLMIHSVRLLLFPDGAPYDDKATKEITEISHTKDKNVIIFFSAVPGACESQLRCQIR